MSDRPERPADLRSDPIWSDLFATPEHAKLLDWGGGRLAFTAADHVRSLVGRSLIEHWLDYGNLRYPQINLSDAGQAVPPTTYTRARRVGEHQLTGCADRNRIIEHLDRGATLVLVNVEQWHAPLTAFCRRLERALAADVQAYVYLTAPGRFGSQPHRDTAHVLAVQIEGTKQWSLYGMPADHDWQRGILPADTTATEQVMLHPGDALYLPPGLGHRAQAGPEGSLHLTISVQTPSVGEVMLAWANRMAARTPMQDRLAVGPDGRVAAIQGILAGLGLAVAEADAAAIAAAVRAAPGPAGASRRLTWPV